MPRGKRNPVEHPPDTLTETTVVTEGDESNKVQVKDKAADKAASSTLILQYIGSDGRPYTTTFECKDLILQKYESTKFLKGGKQTTMSINLEAQVIKTSTT